MRSTHSKAYDDAITPMLKGLVYQVGPWILVEKHAWASVAAAADAGKENP